MKFLFSILFTFFMVTACAPFHSSRSYLTEMDHQDTPFFDAGNDFPVMAGDSGKNWRSNKELKARTPASEDELAERRSNSSIRNELRSLEEAQSEGSLAMYEKYRDRLGSTSEKIYFLKLTHSERREYLESRGLNSEEKRIITPHERMHASRQSDIIIGMSKTEVQQNWGRPARVEVAGNPSYENERWVYSYNGATKYIYFEGGRVGGWE